MMPEITAARDPIDELLVRHHARQRKAVRDAAAHARHDSQLLCASAKTLRICSLHLQAGHIRRPK